jgi:formylglycine-generating enzyme required for sulfatase activity
MMLVPAGSFVCGASAGDDVEYPSERPPHKVTITRAFYLGKFEVTNGQFKKFDAYHITPEFPVQPDLKFDGPDQPVVAVDWAKAHAFCERFGLRLPTDAEWEYACRAGTSTRFPWGDDPDGGKGHANLLNESHKPSGLASLKGFTWDDGFVGTSPVGKFTSSALGLHDMIGNVWEWVADWYVADPAHGVDAVDPDWEDQAAAAKEPSYVWGGVEQKPPFRILRGGSCACDWYLCRSSFRGGFPPTLRNNDIGFRVAKTP